MIKKADIFIIVFVFVIISVIYCLVFFGNGNFAGDKLNIYVDGNPRYSYSFPIYEKKEITVKTEYGSNKIIVDKNSVYVSESDCRGKDCVKIGRIEKNGEFIICVPHHLVIRIENERTEEFDAFTY